jgi:CheY-like chemotaxis protein
MSAQSTILLVEDEHQQRDALTMLFESEGYAVLAAETAEKGLHFLQQTVPHLVVTDVKLPEMDGFTFFDQVRSKPALQRIPFIFITGYNDPAAIEEVKKLGAVGYITKPYELENLLQMVKNNLPPENVLA